MSLREKISQALTQSMKARDQVRTSTLRLIQCAIKDRDIAARAEDRTSGCDEAEILTILAKMVRQREESAKIYDDAGRPELAESERDEMAVILEFLPKPMAEEEIRTAAGAVVEELSASGLKDIGKCMGALKARYSGRMDFAKAGQAVKELLS